jgi:hypothetical protein
VTSGCITTTKLLAAFRRDTAWQFAAAVVAKYPRRKIIRVERRSGAHRRESYRLRRIGVTTVGGASTFGFAVLFASNWLAFRNYTGYRHRMASHTVPVLRSTLTRISPICDIARIL